ncbi:hypothetical protein OC835_001006 [Tilletia horrida]|nr:hypothetical protein OC835_001006 [Tilletia horrida]
MAAAQDDTALAAAAVQEVHLVVLCHGLWGTPANLRHICRSLIKKHPGAYLAPTSDASSRILTEREAERAKKAEEKRKRAQAKGKKPPSDEHAWEQALLEPAQPPEQGSVQLVLLNARSNAERTQDGLDWAAERVRREIDAEVTRLRTKTSPPCHITRFSIIGYSLGGLISRFLIGLLHSRHFFTLVPDSHIPDNVTDVELIKKLRQPPVPVQFVTLATPHLGMLPPTSGFRAFMAYVGARSLSRTGEQLFLRDSGWEGMEEESSEAQTKQNFRRGIIEAMSLPDSLFITALKRFQKVVFYANSVNDPTVPFRTAALYREDPFVVEGLHINIEPDYSGLLRSISYPTEPLPQPTVLERVRKWEVPVFLNPKRNPLRFPLNYLAVPLLPIAFPILLTLILTRFHTESSDSRRRIKELRRLWREERALELELSGSGDDGAAAATSGQNGAPSQRPGLLEDAGRRMSDAPGVSDSAATSGAATPVPAPSTTPQPTSTANGSKSASSKRSWLGTSSSSSTPLSAAEKRKRENEEHLGEQSRIRALLQRVEDQAVDAAEMGDGTVEGNLRRGGDAHHASVSIGAESSNSSITAKHAERFPPIPPSLSKNQPKIFPLQERFIAHFEQALGDKLERRFAYFPKVINSHPIIIVRVPSSELSKMGEGVVRHFVDTFVT